MPKDSEITKLIGGNIKRIRESQGLTKKEFSATVGLSEYELTKIEEGDFKLSDLKPLIKFLPKSKGDC